MGDSTVERGSGSDWNPCILQASSACGTACPCRRHLLIQLCWCCVRAVCIALGHHCKWLLIFDYWAEGRKTQPAKNLLKHQHYQILCLQSPGSPATESFLQEVLVCSVSASTRMLSAVAKLPESLTVPATALSSELAAMSHKDSLHIGACLLPVSKALLCSTILEKPALCDAGRLRQLTRRVWFCCFAADTSGRLGPVLTHLWDCC